MSKRFRAANESGDSGDDVPMDEEEQAQPKDQQCMVQFVQETGKRPFPPFSIPRHLTPDKLLALIHALIEDEDEKETPFTFFINEREIKTTVDECITYLLLDTEKTIDIVYKPQALFRVAPVRRCTSSMPGHGEPVIVAQFAPDGRHLASGSGDATVRFWDLQTETPHFECKGHRTYVLALSWAPDGSRVVSGEKSGQLMAWDPLTGKQMGRTMAGHRQFITGLAWEPLHLGNGECRRFASSSKDGDIRIWDVILGQCLKSLCGHTKSATTVKWGGTGLVYSASQDRTIKVWRAEDGALCRTLQGHGHWVNVLALNTEYVMRTGAYDPSTAQVVPEENKDPAAVRKQKAQRRFDSVMRNISEEFMVSGSDDFTLFLWNPAKEKKSLARMTGHQQLVNDVKFSPDGRFVASASFDKSVRLWNGVTGKFIATFRGHVQAVYQLAWSADSRLIVSGSADSTLKLWSLKTGKLEVDLPGHGDEVFAVDWSPDGQKVVSGGKDKLLRIWRK